MKKTIAQSFVFAAILSALYMAGCGLDSEVSRVSNNNILKAENTIITCTDGKDNDGDGLTDCDDPDCKAMGTTEIPGPGATVCPEIENTVYACSDGIDNDGNGYTDCKDNNCKKTTACCVPTGPENTLEACSDGIDNDCNGYLDCNDNSCKKLAVCCVPTGPETSLDACSDGVDNDCDGYIDCKDRSCSGDGKSYDGDPDEEAKAYCSGSYSVSEEPENTETACQDKADNNLNGLIDCDDPDCKTFAFCQNLTREPPERPGAFTSLPENEKMGYIVQEYTYCTDGIDNDKNGRTDCDEYRCHILSIQSRKFKGTIFEPYMFACDEDGTDTVQ